MNKVSKLGIICSYPFCKKLALYVITYEDKTAITCEKHYFELKALGLTGKSTRLKHEGKLLE